MTRPSFHGLLASLVGVILGCATPERPASNPPSVPSSTPLATAAATPPAPRVPPPPSPIPAPPRLRPRDGDVARIDHVVKEAIQRGDCPGAVVIIARGDQILYRRAHGHQQVLPDKQPMTPEAIFDLASLTKPMVTATAVMQLVERGAIALDDPVTQHLPDFAGQQKEAVTIRQLLAHTSGLPAANPLAHYRDGPDAARARILSLPLAAEPGRQRRYSDVGYVVLGEVVARVSGRPLDDYARERIFEPLEARARYQPEPSLRLVPTNRRGELVAGEPHDLRAVGLGGVAGHAGLFASADDVARFAMMIAGEGVLHQRRVLAPSSVRRLIAPLSDNDERHGLGFSRFADGISHAGFTGTYLWVHPESRTSLVLLTSRLHPDEEGDVTELRQQLRTLALRTSERALSNPVVRTGIDVLQGDDFALLRGRRVGLITNHTGRAQDGRTTKGLIAGAEDVELVAIFSPEHGLRGTSDARVDDGRDPETGRPVYSLYGERQRPTRAQLQGIDTLVFDIQDAGARFYTYVTTLGYALEAATESSIDVVVLDRPNPLGGVRVEGPLLDPERRSFIGYHPLPVRHGMTLGELARMFATEKGLVAPIVVPMAGWSRSMFWRSTGLAWRPPSPNLPSAHAALIYPGLALLEATNVSVGRGTASPFEIVAAPWMDAERLAESLREDADLRGLFVELTEVTPTASRYAGRLCRGLAFHVDDPARFEPLTLGAALARALHRHHPGQWRAERLLTLLGNEEAHRALLSGRPLSTILADWAEAAGRFRERRAPHLLYE